jgi:ribosomal protein L11 methyltransferase
MWWELRLVGLPRRRLEGTTRALFSLGCAGVQEDHLPGQAPPPRQPWDEGPEPEPPAHLVLVAWFEDPDRSAIDEAVAHLTVDASWAEVPQEDWSTSWQAHFPPVEVTERITIAPPWNAPEGALIIEPGQGFGTGQHPTTRQVLQLLEGIDAPGATCLDIGCGSGVLALAAARMGMQARGVDIEPEAVADARRNAERNGLQARFDTTPVHELTDAADIVLANLHGELVVRLAEHLVRLMGEHLLVAGVLDDREAMVREALAPLPLVDRRTEGRWVALHYRRSGASGS